MNKEQFELKAKQLFDERAYQAVWAGDLVIGENSFERLIEELYEALIITDVGSLRELLALCKHTMSRNPKEHQENKCRLCGLPYKR